MARATMKLMASLSTFVLLTACGDSGGGNGSTNPSPSPNSSASWTNTAMLNLVNSKCATSGCHDGSQKPNYKGISETSMKQDTKALAEVKAGKMPIGQSLSAAELSTFKAFYGE